MAQSQYATDADMQQLGITPAAYQRFESISPGCVTQALRAASSVADCELASTFVLPLQTSPQGWDAALTMYVCWIAAYELFFQFGFNPSSPDWQIVTDRKTRAMKFLDDIGNKTITPLYADSSGLPPDADRAGDFILSNPQVGFAPVTAPGSAAVINPLFFWWA